jgi:hypothetical protein
MAISQETSDYHRRYCALRNRKASLIFFGYCSFEVILRLHTLGRGSQVEPKSVIFYIAVVALIVALGNLVVAFKCLRERLVLTIATVSFVFILMKGIFPSFANSGAVPAGRALLVLWTIALAVTLSMVVSAFRGPRQDDRAQ